MFNTTDFNNFYETEEIKAFEEKYNNGLSICKPHKNISEQNTFLIGNINDFFSKYNGYQELFNAKDDIEREKLREEYVNSAREYIEKCYPNSSSEIIEEKVKERQDEINKFCENRDYDTIKNLYQYNGAIFNSDRSKYICHPMLSISGCVIETDTALTISETYAFEYGATVRFYKDPKDNEWKAVTGSLSNAFNFFYGFAMYGLYVRTWFNKFKDVLDEKYKDATIYVHFVLPHAAMVDIRNIVNPDTDRRLKPSAYVLAIVNDTAENSKFLNIDSNDFTAEGVKAVGYADPERTNGVLMNCYSCLQPISEYINEYNTYPTRFLTRNSDCNPNIIPKFIEYVHPITYDNFNLIRKQYKGDLLSTAMYAEGIVVKDIADKYKEILDTNICFDAMIAMYNEQFKWHTKKHINYSTVKKAKNPNNKICIPEYDSYIRSHELIENIKGNFICPSIKENKTMGDIIRYKLFISNLRTRLPMFTN